MNRTDELNAVPALMRSGALGGEEDGVRRSRKKRQSQLLFLVFYQHSSPSKPPTLLLRLYKSYSASKPTAHHNHDYHNNAFWS